MSRPRPEFCPECGAQSFRPLTVMNIVEQSEEPRRDKPTSSSAWNRCPAMPERLHIAGFVALQSDTKRFATMAPLPIVLYLTEELMLDDGHSDEYIADLLRTNLVFAINHFRTQLKDEWEA